MANKEGKKTTRKNGAMLVLALCLVGCAAATTYYAVGVSDTSEIQEEQNVNLNENRKETEAEAVLAPKAEAELQNPITQMDVDPAFLAEQEQTESEDETEEMTTEAADAAKDTKEKTQDAASGTVDAVLEPTVSFASVQELQWPVAGKVIMDYSMDATVYFATLDQYKYNPALIVSAEEGAKVVAAAKGIVDAITTNEETGTTIRMNLGDDYTLYYGQLKEVAVVEGDVVEKGQLLGYVAEPTKYYCEEGSNLYFAMEKEGASEDPFLYLE